MLPWLYSYIPASSWSLVHAICQATPALWLGVQPCDLLWAMRYYPTWFSQRSEMHLLLHVPCSSYGNPLTHDCNSDPMKVILVVIVPLPSSWEHTQASLRMEGQRRGQSTPFTQPNQDRALKTSWLSQVWARPDEWSNRGLDKCLLSHYSNFCEAYYIACWWQQITVRTFHLNYRLWKGCLTFSMWWNTAIHD